MVLTLEVTGPQAKPGAGTSKVFRAVGGTIGRQASNDLVLSDQYVSSRHARLRYADGAFYLEDQASANGVCVNSADYRLQPGESYLLKHGDVILIEPFKILVSIAQDVVEVESGDPFEPVQAPMRGPSGSRSPQPPPGGLLPSELSAESLNLDDFGFGKVEQNRPIPKPEPRPSRPLNYHFEPPAPVAPAPVAPVIPTNWDNAPVAPAAPAKPPAAPEVPAARPAAAPPSPKAPRSDPGLTAVLEAAGIDVTGLASTPELAEHFGQILRVVVEGLMELLQARQHIKTEFDLRATSFQRADNNPLKFSANLEDALHNLLVKRNAAYLGPVAAFEDAFQDLRYHQLAMLHGVRQAFAAMLTHFDPDELQREFDSQVKKGSLVSVPAKLRYWDQYREKVRDMVSDENDSFQELFGNAFAKAYEKQLALLKAQGRIGKV